MKKTLAIYILANYIGITEKVGKANSPTILGWIRKWFKSVTNTNAVPWCSIGMIEAALALGLPCNNQTPAAISWASWGKEIKPSNIDITKNQVIVLRRTGGHHVCAAIRYSAAKGLVYGVGFNQSDSCTVDDFPLSQVITVRQLD